MDYFAIVKLFLVFFLFSFVVSVFEMMKKSKNTHGEYFFASFVFSLLCFAFVIYVLSMDLFSWWTFLSAAPITAIVVLVVLGIKIKLLNRFLLVLVLCFFVDSSFNNSILERIIKNKNLKIEIVAKGATNYIRLSEFSSNLRDWLPLVREAKDTRLKLLEYRLMLESRSLETQQAAIRGLRAMPELYTEFKILDQLLDLKTTDINLSNVRYSALAGLKGVVNSQIVLPAEYRSGNIVVTPPRLFLFYFMLMLTAFFLPLLIYGGIQRLGCKYSF